MQFVKYLLDGIKITRPSNSMSIKISRPYAKFWQSITLNPPFNIDVIVGRPPMTTDLVSAWYYCYTAYNCCILHVWACARGSRISRETSLKKLIQAKFPGLKTLPVHPPGGGFVKPSAVNPKAFDWAAKMPVSVEVKYEYFNTWAGRIKLIEMVRLWFGTIKSYHIPSGSFFKF